MELYLTIWWVWILIAIGFGILELLAPSQIFLGFGIGAFAVGILTVVGIAMPAMAAVVAFAILSIASWYGLRQIWGNAKGQRSLWDQDINSNEGKKKF